MVGDWIKMRTDLYRDPKVIQIADLLMDEHGPLARYVNQINQRKMSVTRNVTRNVTVGALVTVWGVMRHQGSREGNDLVASGSTASVLDDLAELPGLGSALVAVGWVIESESGLRFPKFFAENNVDPSEDLRAKNKERQQRFRDKKRNVTRNVTVTSFRNAREEKEKSKELSKDSSRDAKKRFTKPTIEQVQAYIAEKNFSVDGRAWIDHYESNGWRVGKNSMRDWKAAVRTWHRNQGKFSSNGTVDPVDPRGAFAAGERFMAIMEGRE